MNIQLTDDNIDILLEGLGCLEEMSSMGYPPIDKQRIDKVRQQLKSAKDIFSPDTYDNALGQTRN